MFWENFIELCNNKNKTPTSVISELNISRGSVTHWKSGKVPHHNTLIKIADYFGVSVDYLLGKTDTPESPKSALSPGKQKIVDMCDSLSAEDLQKVIEYTEFIIAKKKER